MKNEGNCLITLDARSISELCSIKYINLNTEMRKNAKNDFFKLMNNYDFGKTMENIRKRVDIKLVSNYKKYEKLVSKPNYKYTIFSENLVAII